MVADQKVNKGDLGVGGNCGLSLGVLLKYNSCLLYLCALANTIWERKRYAYVA